MESNNCKKLQDLCREGEFGALLLTGAVNRFYATGLHSSAGAALLGGERAVFMTDFRYIEAARERLKGFEVRMVTREQGCTYEDMISGLLSEWEVGRVGFEEQVWTVSEHRRWSQKLNVELVPADSRLADIRAVKEDWEIDRMIRAQRIAERAFDRVVAWIQPGMTERQIAAELVYHMLRNGADRLSFEPIVVAGPNSALPHGEPGDRPVQDGDFLIMDFGCVADGYCSDMTRTVAIGYADNEMCRVYEVVLEAQRAGLEAARAGVVGREIHEAAARVIADAGYGEYFGHGFGHGIGLEVHEEYCANMTEGRALPDGAVISAEPGIYLPGRFGVRIEDCVVLRQGGFQNLMTTAKELLIL